MKDIFNVGGPGEDGYNRFLCGVGDGLAQRLRTLIRSSSAMVSMDLEVSEDWLCRKVCKIMARAPPKR